MIALAKFCIEDTGPEIIPGKEGLETAVQERASAFYNLMFTHGSFCQDSLKLKINFIRVSGLIACPEKDGFALGGSNS